jgi:hypothetical protein
MSCALNTALLIACTALALVFAVAIVLALLERQREVKRLHRMRRAAGHEPRWNTERPRWAATHQPPPPPPERPTC